MTAIAGWDRSPTGCARGAKRASSRRAAAAIARARIGLVDALGHIGSEHRPRALRERARAVGAHLHPRGRRATARRRQYASPASTFDGSCRPVACLAVAKPRNRNLEAVTTSISVSPKRAPTVTPFRLNSTATRPGRSVHSCKDLPYHYSSSCGKYLTTRRSDWKQLVPVRRSMHPPSPATTPRAAPDPISAVRAGPLPFRCDAARRALAARFIGEELHEIERRVARSCCDSTIGSSPMKQPCGCSVSKSRGRSPIDAVDAPGSPPGDSRRTCAPAACRHSIHRSTRGR